MTMDDRRADRSRMLRRRVVGILGSGLLAGAALVGGCAPTHGVDLTNNTDQVVTFELLAVDPAGISTVYSTGVINRGAGFTNTMDGPVRGQSMRARFFLQGQSLNDDNWVMLNLSEKTTRYYALEVVNGRLRAVEQKRGRPEAKKSTE